MAKDKVTSLQLQGLIQDILRFGMEYKTRATLERSLTRLLQGLYAGVTTLPKFVDESYSLMRQQIYSAVYQAARKIWPDATERADNLRMADIGWVQDMANEQLLYIIKLGGEVLEASATGKAIDPFISRVELWGARYDEAYNKALIMLGSIADVLRWEYGPTEHCETCLALNGQIATAYHWKLSGYRPQGKMLECGGWRCQCSLVRLTKRELAALLDSGWVSTVPMA